MQRTNTLIEAQTNPFRVYTGNSCGNIKVNCILSSSCSKQRGVFTQHALSSCSNNKQLITPSLRCETCRLMVLCDDRLIFVTYLLRLFPKMACLFLKKGFSMPGRRERARMRKMCLHGPWEIPSLFAITVTFQNSAVVSVIPAKERTRVILLSHHWECSDSEWCWGKMPLSKRSICFNLKRVKRKI